MAAPSTLDTRPVDPVFQQLVGGLANEAENFGITKILPAIPVDQSTGTLFTVGTEAFFGDVDETYKRNNGDYAETKGYALATSTYDTVEYGLTAVTDVKKMQRSQLMNLRGMNVHQAMSALEIAQEVRGNAVLINANYTQTTLNAAQQWDNSGSNPVGDINTVVESIRTNGMLPGVFAGGPDAWSALRTNPSILSFNSVTVDNNILSEDALVAKLGSWFGFSISQRMGLVRNSVSMGQTASLAKLWGDDVFIGVISTGAAQMGPGKIGLRPTAAYRLVETDFVLESAFDWDKRSHKDRIRHEETAARFTLALGQNILATNP